MTTRPIEVSIRGISPLLMHRFNEESEKRDASRDMLRESITPREEAERVLNRLEDGTLYMPGAVILGCVTEAGANHKMRGSRKAVKWLVPSAMLVPDDVIPVLNGDGKSKAKSWEVDSRPVVIPATKGRIMRHRPRFEQWSMNFRLEVDDQIMPVDLAHQLLEEGGRRLGIGDFRPQKRGPFGRFEVTKWKNGSE